MLLHSETRQYFGTLSGTVELPDGGDRPDRKYAHFLRGKAAVSGGKGIDMEKKLSGIKTRSSTRSGRAAFKDADGDGVGDLMGVYEKLDYLKSLHVDAIWFSPLYPSPNADFGYDVADYMDISAEYGGMAAFKKVLDGAHERAASGSSWILS